MATTPGPTGREADEVRIDDLIEACDLLIDRLDRYHEEREAEWSTAQESGDERYQFRVRRGIDWSDQLLDRMDDVLERVGQLRHNHNQLEWARQGKMV